MLKLKTSKNKIWPLKDAEIVLDYAHFVASSFLRSSAWRCIIVNMAAKLCLLSDVNTSFARFVRRGSNIKIII